MKTPAVEDKAFDKLPGFGNYFFLLLLVFLWGVIIASQRYKRKMMPPKVVEAEAAASLWTSFYRRCISLLLVCIASYNVLKSIVFNG